MTFAQRIIYLRKLKKGRTQQQAAIGIGINIKKLGTYEEGRAEPNFETLKKIAKYYNVTSDYLIGNTETEPLPEIMNHLFLKASKAQKEIILKILA